MRYVYMDLPKFEYFDFGNVWKGSILGDFNYKISPENKAEPPVIRMSIWYGDKCFELSEIEKEYTEDFSEQGYKALVDRLLAEVDDYRDRAYR